MSENPGKFNDFIHIFMRWRILNIPLRKRQQHATYRVKNAGYTKILYIQKVFLTNCNEIRNLKCKKTNDHNGKHTKLGFMLLLC